jgi:hypothetical protein
VSMKRTCQKAGGSTVGEALNRGPTYTDLSAMQSQHFDETSILVP